MKAVIDANIIISGLRFGGAPRHILDLCSNEEIHGFSSDEALREIEAVLQSKFGVSANEWVMVQETLRDVITIVSTTDLPEVPQLRDKRDLHILAAAASCEADVIVSGDKDLLVLQHYKNIRIIDAQTLIRQLGNSK